MDRMASRIIILSVILCIVTGIGYVATMMPLLLPDAIAFHLIGVGGWLLDRLPGRAFNALVSGLGFMSFATLVSGCSVSLITGLRALRVGCIKQGLAMSACGVVLGTLLSGGPLAFHLYMRSTLDHARGASRDTMERIRQRLEAGQFPEDRRHQVWRMYAHSIYRDEGVQAQIPDEHGSMMTYQPTESEVAARHSWNELLKRFRPPHRYTVVAILFVAFLVGLGVFTPVREEPPLVGVGGAPANQAAQPSAGAIRDSGA